MKVILYAAVSLDGFIAREDGDSGWVSDTGAFEQAIESAGGYVVGSKTFRQFQSDLYPIKGVVNIVLSSQNVENDSVEVAVSPKKALELAHKHGLTEIIVVGGSETWQTFVDSDLCDEIVVDIESVFLGGGMSFLRNFTKKLELVSTKKLSHNVVQNHYRVQK